MPTGASSPRSGKTCKICKQDCSKKPRVKNADGDYFCEACLEQKKAEAALLAGAEPAARHPQAKRGDEPATFGVDEPDLDLSTPKGLWDDPPAGGTPVPATGALSCPKCGAMLTPMAVLCVSCGFNTQGKGRVKTKVGKAVDLTPLAPSRSRRKGLTGVKAWLAFAVISAGFIGLGFGGGISQPMLFVALAVFGVTSLACLVSLAIGAFRSGATLWGVLIIASVFLNFIPVVGLILSLALLYYVFAVNQNVVLKIVYGALILGVFAMAVSIFVNSPDLLSALPGMPSGGSAPTNP